MPSMQSVPSFCADNGLSRSLFYRLLKDGRGPRVTKIGRRSLISGQAAAEWRARMEAEPSPCATTSPSARRWPNFSWPPRHSAGLSRRRTCRSADAERP